MQQKALRRLEEGKSFLGQGKLSNAERAFKKALKISPDIVDAHNYLGNVYLAGSRFNEALIAYRKALKLAPGHPVLLCNIGNLLQLRGSHEQAVEHLEDAIARQPDLAAAHHNLGNALWSLGKTDSALAAYGRALELNPKLADTLRNLGAAYTQLERFDEAVDCFQRALEINPDDRDALLGLGKASSERGNLDAAVSAYQRAASIDPQNARPYRELGKALSDHGEIERAIAAHRKSIELDPENAAAYRSLANNKTFSERDEDIAAMESLFEKSRLPEGDLAELGFGLGKAYEDLGDYDKSMEYVNRANRLRRETIDYSGADSSALFERIKAVFSADFFARRGGLGDDDRSPVFILGMPRSGTSLVEQILASHPRVYGAGELNDLQRVYDSIPGAGGSGGFPDAVETLLDAGFAELGRSYVAAIRRYSADAELITDKMPNNYLRIGFIRAILPRARIIHCVRDPMDNCLSLYKNNLLHGNDYSYDLSELGQYYRLYLDLMEHWKTLLPDFVFDFGYEALIADPRERVTALLDYCDLPWDEACIEFYNTRRKVKTASNAQVRRPIYSDSAGLWKRYEKHLEALQTALYG